jgi:DNA-binding MarR family transcriptional regulator
MIVLSVLAEQGPMRLGELAGKVPCSQPTATTVVTGLEPGGLVRREPDPDDGRAVLVTLTERGLKRINAMTNGQATLLAQRIRELGEDEQGTLLAAVPLLRRLTEEANIPPSRRPWPEP